MSCSYKGNEPSPKGLGKCAHLLKEGTISKGKDGNKWIVKKRSNGSLYWSKMSFASVYHSTSKSDSTSTVNANANTNKEIKTSSPKGKHRILVTEPTTYQKRNKFVNFGKPFYVTTEFYNVLFKMPKRYDSDIGNAYLFGKKYKPHEYKKIGSHGNDAAQTGIIDYDMWDDNFMLSKELKNKWYKIDEKYKYSYDSYNNIKEIRNLSNGAIIFQGETVGGDVGADVYAHYNNRKEIDSLIIDNNYFFKYQE